MVDIVIYTSISSHAVAQAFGIMLAEYSELYVNVLYIIHFGEPVYGNESWLQSS